jgi:hypothetical protein
MTFQFVDYQALMMIFSSTREFNQEVDYFCIHILQQFILTQPLSKKNFILKRIAFMCRGKISGVAGYPIRIQASLPLCFQPQLRPPRQLPKPWLIKFLQIIMIDLTYQYP